MGGRGIGEYKGKGKEGTGVLLPVRPEVSGRGLSLRDYLAGVTLSFPSCFHVLPPHSSDLFLSSGYGVVVAVLLLVSGKY